MSILEKFFPQKKKEEQEARENYTASTIDDSVKARRDAEAALIRSYRNAGIVLKQRHDWSK